MSYDAKILADSITEHGERFTTFEVTFPRIVLAEINTHKMLSKNSASSRAIPVAKKIAGVETDPFVPAAFIKNQKGMQGAEALEDVAAGDAQMWWQKGIIGALQIARGLADAGLHKALANRVLEPYAWHTAILSGTDWSNFFHLRVNPDAQGEFRTAAEMMLKLYEEHKPMLMREGDWHLPLILDEEKLDEARSTGDIERLVKISVARCARVSYLTHAGVRDQAEDLALYDKLLTGGHLSPLEHAARPMTDDERRMTGTWDVSFVDGPTVRVRWGTPVVGQEIVAHSGALMKIARVRGPLHYAANLNGWLSRRSFLLGEEDILGHRAKQAQLAQALEDGAYV